MSLKAFIPSGQTALTVNGLHQWDYGQKLEIHDDDLPAEIEVHFACVGMAEAVVRSCNVVQGVAEAAIPDQCLEQTAPITAYIVEVGVDSRATTKVLVLTVSPRPRPQEAGTLTPAITDKYTELIAAVNEQVAALKAGNVTVARALTADTAAQAQTAKSATWSDETQLAHEAEWADEAGRAEKARDAETAATATSAVKATQADTAKELTVPNMHDPYTHTITQAGLYMVSYYSLGAYYTDMIYIPYVKCDKAYGSAGHYPTEGTYKYKGVVYSGDTQTFSLLTVNTDDYITKIWLIATEYQGEVDIQ